MKKIIFWFGFSRIFAAGLQAISFVLLARLTTPSVFGEFTAAFAIAASLYGLTSLGIASLISRSFAEKRFSLLGSALRLNLFSSIFCFSVVAVTSVIVLKIPLLEALIISVLLSSSLLLDRYIDIEQSIRIAAKSFKLIVVSQFMRSTTSLISFLAFVPFLDPVLAFVLGRSLGSLCGLLIIRSNRAHQFKQQKITKELIRELAPLTLHGWAANVLTLDVALVALLAGSEAAAYYGVSSKLLSPAGVVGNSLAQLTIPIAVKLQRESASKWAKRLLIFIFVGAVCSIPIGLFSTTIPGLLFGSDYSDSGVVLSVMVLGIVPAIFTPVIHAFMQGRGDSALVAKISAPFSVITLFVVGVGALSLGAIGGAIAFTAVAWVYLFISYALCDKALKTNVANQGNQ